MAGKVELAWYVPPLLGAALSAYAALLLWLFIEPTSLILPPYVGFIYIALFVLSGLALLIGGIYSLFTQQKKEGFLEPIIRGIFCILVAVILLKLLISEVLDVLLIICLGGFITGVEQLVVLYLRNRDTSDF